MKNVKPLLTYLVAFAAFALVDRFLFDHPVIQVLAMASLVLFAAQLLRLILGCLKPKERKGMTLISLLSSLLHYVAAIVILCWGLSILGVNVNAIVASVGIVALIVGFGAESLVADVVTGIFLLFENQYNVGDIVEVNGFRGTVKEIGIRTTSIMDVGGEARKDVMETAPRYLGVQQLADSSVILRFVVDVAEKDIYTGARILNRDLWLGFRKLGVECPFPQVDVHSK